jgi:hypothetical protein
MTLTPKFMHCRSLTVAAVTLTRSLLGAPEFLPAFTKPVRPIGTPLLLSASAASVILLALCCIALANLIRDVKRGYSPARCSVAALFLLFAIASPVVLGVEVFHHL